ncbi:MAG: PIN domain-containing protein [Pyrinomonadaceae bacterium]
MDEFVADTHALIWYFIDSPKLGPNAHKAFEDADRGQAIIHVPAIILAELYYANVKTGKTIDFDEVYNTLDSGSQFVLTPFDPKDVLDFERDSAVSEMHDRIIVGLAVRLGCPLLTVDKNITASGSVEVVW